MDTSIWWLFILCNNKRGSTWSSILSTRAIACFVQSLFGWILVATGRWSC